MGLFAGTRDLLCHKNVAALAHPTSIPIPEGVAGEGSRGRPPPGHDHPAIQAPCERHSDALLTLEVAGQIPGEDVPQLLVIGLRRQRGLVLPFPRLEVCAFPLH